MVSLNLCRYSQTHIVKGLSSSPFLVINAKGEKVLSPNQKDHTTISKILQMFISIGI
jgi:hypothetical protein